MNSLCKMTISFKVYDELLSLLNISDAEAFEMISEDDLIAKIKGVKMALSNRDELIKQNQSLQQNLRKIKKYDIRELLVNSINFEYAPGSRVVAYSFYSFLNSLLHIAAIKTESKIGDKTLSRIYIGFANGANLNADLRQVALYGQKIYEEILDV